MLLKYNDSKKVLSSHNNRHVSRNSHITLVCFAIKEEAAPFVRLTRQHPDIKIVVTGIGKRNAENAVLSFFEQQTPILVLTCGFAGGLSPELDSGTIVYEEDPDTKFGFALEKLGAKRIRFFCASRMIITSSEKRALRQETGADAVEMESGHIRRLCNERNIPWITVRVISDTANEELPLDFNLFMNKSDRISYVRLVRTVLKSPSKVPKILSFRKRSIWAAEKLADALKDVLQ